MLVLVVSVKVKPGRADDYIAAVQADGEGTHANEEGNFQFSCVRDQNDPDRFFLFEVYKDEAALEAHRGMPHFLKYREATAGIYAEETVRHMCTNVFPPDSWWTS
ncbi:MAG: antibiotic biosynthesis monooxygenase [Chloroflexi bacterium]|nr:antibiotic biosynthesis monooxygenase [Chloroflexota bacterium]MYB84513.1 antibiotic biosynthesis monooxygenase [Chloroflexota bacterium]